MASNSLHEQEGEMVADLVEDYFYYEKLISGQILIFFNGDEDEAIDIDNELVISNKQHEQMALDQIYKDKETLKIVVS